MEGPTSVVEGWLTQDGEKTPVTVRYASKYSIWVQSTSAGLTMPVDTFGNLTLQLQDKEVDLGRCRSFADSGRNGHVRRFVPLDGLHDFESLFEKSRVELLESSLVKLPLVLGHKERINPRFKDFVSDLTYDLNCYKNLLDGLDSECSNEPKSVREHIQDHLLSTVGSEIFRYLDESLDRLDQAISGLSHEEHEHHGFYFRKQLWNFLMSAPIMRRTNLKPRGYSGDSEMMRMIYANDYAGTSTFGRVLHKYAVEQRAADAVRNRRQILASMVRERLDSYEGSAEKRTRILSVACGPAYEVQDILREESACDRLHFSLLDQDEQALMEAANMVGRIETRFDRRLSVDLIRESVRTMLFTQQLRKRWGKFDFIYSMGLFDYLTPPVARAVLRRLYSLLNKGGVAVIGNFSDMNQTRVFMEYWLDWKILHRTRDELLDLASGLEKPQIKVSVDDTGIQMLLEITKPVEDGEN